MSLVIQEGDLQGIIVISFKFLLIVVTSKMTTGLKFSKMKNNLDHIIIEPRY